MKDSLWGIIVKRERTKMKKQKEILQNKRTFKNGEGIDHLEMKFLNKRVVYSPKIMQRKLGKIMETS